jgi:hypothetical protein
MSDSKSVLRAFHEAALDSLYALVRFRDLVLRHGQLPREQHGVLPAETLYQEYLVPLLQGSEKIAGVPEHEATLERMTAARIALARDLPAFGTMPAASAHELVFGLPLIFTRRWNRYARPAAAETPPTPSASWKLVLYAPQEGMNAESFLDDAHLCLHGYDPLPLHAELKLEYAKAAELIEAAKPPPPAIWHHGKRAYSIDGMNSLVVTIEEDYILQTFLKAGRAMDTREIQNESGVTNVSRVIGQLCNGYGKVFAAAIRTPEGRKGSGGYLIRVRPLATSRAPGTS